MKRIFLFTVLFYIGFAGWCQSNVSAGFLPRVNVSADLSDRFKLMSSIESRQIILESFSEDLSFKYSLTDISGLLSFKTGSNTHLNGGYTLRLLDAKAFHRFIQQFNIINKFEGMRLGHRVASDQTFGHGMPPDFRFRYRISIQKPLNGQEADPKEFYLKFSNEYLFSLQDGNQDIEVRITPHLGYSFSTRNKIEFGIDYRFNEFVRSASDHDFWVNVIWYSAFDGR